MTMSKTSIKATELLYSSFTVILVQVPNNCLLELKTAYIIR